jgi:hypothetical protein
MTDIDKTLTRLDIAAGLGELLAAAWDGFGVLLAGCRDGERRSAELSAAFAFAAVAAAEGRLILESAPSLPAGGDAATGTLVCVNADPDIAADNLSGLAQALGTCLSAAAGKARLAGDRQACAQAAAAAARAGELLARDR